MAQDNYFDYDNAADLTPSGVNIVDWLGNHWQNNATPGGAGPLAFIHDGSVIFSTGGLNQLQLNGAAAISILMQETLNTETIIGGTGELTIRGFFIDNYSDKDLVIQKGLSLVFETATSHWTADIGRIIVDASISGHLAILNLTGTQSIHLGGNNSYTGNTAINTLVVAGNTKAFGASTIQFEGGTLFHEIGLIQDFSKQFTMMAGSVTIDTNGNNLVWTGSLEGGNVVTKTGNGRLQLGDNSPSFSGRIIVNQGILAIGSGANTAGTKAGAADNLEVLSGATLDLSAGGTNAFQDERVSLAGHGVGFLGAVMKNSGLSGDNFRLNQVTLTNHTTINMNVRYDFDSVFQANGFSVTKIGSDQLPFEGGTNTQNIGNVYIKQGAVNFSSSSDMGYSNSATFGNTVYANSGTGLLFWTKNTDEKRITLNGGYMQRNGSVYTQSLNQTVTVTGGLELNAGNSDIRHGQTSLVFALGSINRHVGATLNVANTSALVPDGATPTGNPVLATTTSANENDIIGGYLTYGGNTWAVNSGATLVNGTANVIVGLAEAQYATNVFSSASSNVNVTSSVSALSDFTVNSLRFHNSGAKTLTLSGTNTVASGGILVTPGVGAFTTEITGGILRGSSVLRELIIHQNNGSGALTISSIIADNGGASAFTRSGGGVVNLRNVNTYTGNTYINGAAGTGGSGILDVNDIKSSGNDNLGATTNQLFLNNGTLRYSSTTTNADLARQVNLLSGGGTFDVVDAARALTLSGKITGEALAADEGHYFGQGNLVKTGAGTLIVNNGTNDYTGTTTVSAGILRLSGPGKLGASIARLTVNSGGTLELNGTNQQVGLLMGTSGGIIRNGSATDSLLSIGHDNATHVFNGINWGYGNGYEGIIQDGSGGGKVSLQKTGVGYQIFSGVNTYTGTTTVTGGALQIGNGTGVTHAARSGSGLHIVAAGATLAGNGIIGGSVVVNEGGLLSIGNFGQTAEQTLTINGGLISDGNINFDIWTHADAATKNDILRFTGTDAGAVEINGKIFVNNALTAPSTWAVGESIQLIDWGYISFGERSFSGDLDISRLDLTNTATTYWDTSRFLLNGTIFVRAMANAFIWDVNSGSNGPQDGTGVWNTSNTTWWEETTPGNASFINGSDVFIGSRNGTADYTITVNNPGGISVRDITFDLAGSAGPTNYYYTIAGGTAADNTLTLVADAVINTQHALADSGTTISTRIAGTSWNKTGAGRLILTGDNTFTGELAILEGVVDARHANALGTTAGKTRVGAGATLALQNNVTIAENLDILGSGAGGIGALLNHSGSNTLSGNILLLGNSRVSALAGTLTLSGVISGTGSLTTAADSASAPIRLTGTGMNTYTGGTNVYSGFLILAKNENVDAIAANTVVNIGDGVGSVQDVLRLDQNHQIADTGTVLNFFGSGSQAGVFRINSKIETVGAIQSADGLGIIDNGAAGDGYLTVNNTGTNRFGGIMQNGSAGVLHFAKQNTGTQELSNTSTYTGTTSVNGGVLRLVGANGRLTGTSNVFVNSGGTFELRNTSAANVSNRIASAVPVVLNGGTFSFSNDGSAANYSDTVTNVQVNARHSVISATQAASGNTSILTIGNLQRTGAGTVNFSGTQLGLNARNQIRFGSDPTAMLDHGLIGAWAVVGNEFAAYGDFGVTAFTDYVTSAETAWLFTDNVKVTGALTTLSDDRHVNSLNIQQSDTTEVRLAGHLLRLESGGLLFSGAHNGSIVNGQLTAGTSYNAAGELIIHQNASGNSLDVLASITNNGSGEVALTKSGLGTLILSGSNSFTGGITLNEGTLRLNNAAAFTAGNDLTVHGGTFDLNSHSITVGSLYADINSRGGIIQNSSTTAATLTIGSDHSDSSYYGVIRHDVGILNLTKVGQGTLTLGGNNTYQGTTNINAGTVKIAHANAFGATGAGNRTNIAAGATLEIIAEGAYYESIYFNGRGVNNQGALLVNDAALRGGSDQVKIMNAFLAGDTTISNTKRIDFDSVFDGQGFALTKLGSGEVTFEGSVNIVNQGDLYVKSGRLIWTGVSSLGFSTDDLVIHSGGAAELYNYSGTISKGIVLQGGALRRTGPGGSSVGGSLTATGGLVLKSGASGIFNNNSLLVFHLGNIRRDEIGATLNVDAAGLATTSSTNSNSILGGWATFGGNSWAVNSTNGVNGGIVSLSTYETSLNPADWGSTENISLNANPSAATPGNLTINSLRFTGNSTLTSGGLLTISSGGILTSGSAVNTITGGTLTGSASGALYVHQNSSGLMTIASNIVNNSGATALVKSGSGALVLSGENTYSGGTYINGSTGGSSWGILRVQTISDTGASNLGQSSGGSNGLYFNRGILDFTAAAGSTTSTGRNVQLLSGGGDIRVSNATAVLQLTGTISGESLAGNEGASTEQGILRKSGAGELVLAGSTSNTYTGNTYVDAGILALNKNSGLDAIIGNIIIETAGTLRWDNSNQVSNTSLLTMNGNARANLNGMSEVLGGLVSTSTNANVGNSAAGASTLELAVAANNAYTYAGSITGNVKVTKSGDGKQILTGNGNTYTGGTEITDGTLQIGDGGTGGTLGSGNVTVAADSWLVVDKSSNLNISQNITGAGGFVQAGTGATIFAAGSTHTYTGVTNVQSGTLVVNSSVQGSSGQFNVTGGTLAGTGVVNGNTVIKENGGLAIGDTTNPVGSPATLTINGNLELQRSISSEVPRLVFDVYTSSIYNDVNLRAGGDAYTAYDSLSDYYATTITAYEAESGTHDRLNILGDFRLDAGALLVINSVNHSFVAGDVFDLIDWTGVFTYNHAVDGAWNVNSDLILPELAAGLEWDRSLFLSQGILTVTLVPEPSRAVLFMIGISALLLRRRRQKQEEL